MELLHFRTYRWSEMRDQPMIVELLYLAEMKSRRILELYLAESSRIAELYLAEMKQRWNLSQFLKLQMFSAFG